MKTNRIHALSSKLEKSHTLSRRTFLQLSSLGLGGLFVWSCNEPPPNPSPISWQPHALRPVFYGLREYGTTNGAPGPCRVFFPTLDGSPDSAAILPGRYPYPLILFAHGHCNEAGHYKKWFRLPAQLARCGYVVVVPEMPSIASHPSLPDHPSLTRMAQMVAWMRSGWQYSHLLYPAPAPTGVIGHSYGALLGARFAAANEVTAYVSLAGVWTDWPSGPLPVQGLNKPMFFIRGTSDWHANISTALWDSLAQPKHMAVFKDGLHWDYLRPGTTSCENSNGRGPCTLTPVLTEDLVAMFFAKYLPPKKTGILSLQIPDSLIPPLPLDLTFEQEFYAGSHLTGFPFTSSSGCELTLSWNTFNSSGSVKKP